MKLASRGKRSKGFLIRNDMTVRADNRSSRNGQVTAIDPNKKTAHVPTTIKESRSAARHAGLAYTSADQLNLFRRKTGHGFKYERSNGTLIKSPRVLKRIQSLVIPPAWKDVWICSNPRGHLQATGHDKRGRKQFIYHPKWREVRDQNKYDRLVDFAKNLPSIRRRVRRALRSSGLSREKVLATIVRLLDTSHIRIGNEEYAQQNRSFGLTTFRNHHVEVHGRSLRFQFRGKSGVKHNVQLDDQRLARIVKRCQDLPGQELFQYLDDEGERRDVSSDDVNDYLRSITGENFTAKDFRTWAGTVQAAALLCKCKPASSLRQTKSLVNQAVEAVARELGNTKSVCRKGYIHPAIFKGFEQGTLARCFKNRRNSNKKPHSRSGLSSQESAVLKLLRQGKK